MVITTCFSILAPLSWFIIFKTHSYVHTEMNYITWYIPFCLFGFGILGIVITRLIQKLKDGFNTVGGEDVFYISNPALGLWALKKQFK